MSKPETVASSATVQDIDESLLRKSNLSIEEKVAIATSVGEEVLMPEELSALFKAKEHPIVYDGFEPSGRMVSAFILCRVVSCRVELYIVKGLVGSILPKVFYGQSMSTN